MKAVVLNGKIIHINGCGHGGMINPKCEYHSIPDQEIPESWWRAGSIVADLEWPGPLARDLDQEKATIDRDTGKAIDKAVHPFAGTDESIGILRDQMVQWGNALGLEFTPGFIRMNEIAIAEIEKAKAVKDAQDN